MEQTPGQQDPGPSGTPPAGEAPSGDTPASAGSPPPPGWEAPPGGAASPPPWGAAPPYGTAPPPPVRRLYRLRNDRVVAGVASGLAAHLELDPVWVRLAFVVLAFIGGLGILLYIVAWVVMPPVDAPPYAGPVPPPSVRRLYRLRNDRWIAGVASGLGAYLEVDANLVRLAFFILGICGGLGVVLYIVAWVLMPAVDGVPPSGWRAGSPGRGAGADLRIIAGAFFLIVAVLVLASNFDFHYSGVVWGAVLICIGLLFLVGDSWPSRYASEPATPPTDPGHAAGFMPAQAGEASVPTFAAADQPYAPRSAYSYTPTSYAPYTPQPAYATPVRGTAAAWSESAYRSRGLRLGTVGVAAVTLALGVALLLQSVGVIHLTVESGFGVALLVLGLTLVVGARFGGSGGLVALGICLLPFAAAAVLVPEPLTGGAGNVSYSPQVLSAVQPVYRLAAGQLYVDLSGVDLGSGNVTVTSSVAFGHLVVVVPADTTVDLTGKVGAGEDNLLGRIDSGVQISSRFDVATGAAPTGTLTLQVSVGCGQLTVETGGQ